MRGGDCTMKIQYKTLHGWVSCLLPGQAEAFLASCVARYGYIRGRGDVVRLLRRGLVLRYGVARLIYAGPSGQRPHSARLSAGLWLYTRGDTRQQGGCNDA